MNDPDPDSEVNILSVSFSMVRSTAICPHCRGETRVVALLVPPGHRVRSLEDGADDVAEESARRRDSWERAPRQALIFYVESLPEAAGRRMQQLAPMYRLAASPATQGSYWANHCERCGGIQEDHDLFCEPQGAFVPLGPAAASAMELVPVAEALAAAAAGYAFDPEFVGFGSQA